MNHELTGGGCGQNPVHPDDLDGLLAGWIQTQGELDDAEADNLHRGRIWATRTQWSMEDLLDDRWLMRLHRQCFGDVWSWAGTPRIRATSIGIDPIEVPRALRDALLDGKFELSATGDPKQRATALAGLHHRLAAVHPFANGNGRTLRLHTELLARALGEPAPTWGVGSREARRLYLSALHAADEFDLEPLRAFMWS